MELLVVRPHVVVNAARDFGQVGVSHSYQLIRTARHETVEVYGQPQVRPEPLHHHDDSKVQVLHRVHAMLSLRFPPNLAVGSHGPAGRRAVKIAALEDGCYWEAWDSDGQMRGRAIDVEALGTPSSAVAFGLATWWRKEVFVLDGRDAAVFPVEQPLYDGPGVYAGTFACP